MGKRGRPLTVWSAFAAKVSFQGTPDPERTAPDPDNVVMGFKLTANPQRAQSGRGIRTPLVNHGRMVDVRMGPAEARQFAQQVLRAADAADEFRRRSESQALGVHPDQPQPDHAVPLQPEGGGGA